MATAALNSNPPPTPTTAMVMTEPPSSSSSADEQQQQYLSSTSSTVSQSPIQEGTDHSCSNDNHSDAATTILQQQRNSDNNNSSTVIINPYKKKAPNPPSIHNQDPKVHRRRQFIEKYRLQSLHNNNNNNHHRQGGGEMIASSRSALEVLRLHQQWRQQWRRRSEHQPQQQSLDNSCTKNDNKRSYNKQFALRPRLFLFQRMMQPQRMESNSMTSQHDQQQHQRHQQQGVWELGTGITELSGEGGSGKTQICLSLCMTCALTPLLYDNNNNNASSSLHPTTQSNDSSNDGNNYTSIYITMGEGIPQSKVATRLHQMLHHRVPNIHNNNNNQDDDHDDEVERILSRIWLLSLKNEDDFIEFVEIHLPNILKNQSCGIKPPPQQQQQQTPNNQYPTCYKVGFIAFDGIANFFRFSDPLFQQHSQSNNYNQKSMFHQHRSSKLFQISSLLRKMSDVYDVPIVITNQVTSNIPSDDGLLLKRPSDDMSCMMMGGVGQNNKIQPALGLIWSNCVTTRFILQRKDGVMAKISTGVNDDGGGESASENGNSSNANKKEATAAATTTTTMQRVRKASVLQSVCTPEESEVWYVIDAGAVVAVSRAHRSDDR